MDEPDFSSYTEAQLLQVLSRVDAVRFPERVKEIERHLAAISQLPVHAEGELDTPVASPIPPIAGLWRRIGAFCIDMMILGLIGMAVGTLLYEQFSALGAWGRLVGFIITLVYFGVTESRLCGGQSLGMKLLGLKVVSRTGEALSTPAAFVRAAIFCLAYFLNGAEFDLGLVGVWGNIVMSMIIFGLVFSVFYMFLFNRRTRQSIHDLAVGSFVIRAESDKISLPTAPVWRGHAAVLGVALFAVVVGSLWSLTRSPDREIFAALNRLQDDITVLPGVDRVGITVLSASANNTTINYLNILAVVDSSTPNTEALARRIAQIALKNYAAANQQHAITVTVMSGYDIGISSRWHSVNHVSTPAEWRVRSITPT